MGQVFWRAYFGVTEVSDCDSNTNWSGTRATNPPSVDSADKKEGDASLEATSTGAAGQTAYIRYNPAGTWNWSGKEIITFWFKCTSSSMAEYFIHLNDGVNWKYYSFSYDTANVWQFYEISISSFSDTGVTNMAAIDFVFIGVKEPAGGAINPTFNVDIVDISDKLLDVLSLSTAKEFWAPDDFVVSIPNDTDHRAMLLGSAGYTGAGKIVKLYRQVNQDNPIINTKGFIQRIRANNDQIQITGKGTGAYLSRYVTGDNVYYITTPATQIISQVCYGTGIRLGSTGADVPNVSCRFYAENKWRAVMDVAKNFADWEAFVETDDTITFKSEIGTDRSASFTMLYGYNVISDGYRDIDYEQIGTRVKVRGEGEGFNQIKASAVNTTAEADYWQREIVYDDRSIDNQTLAQNVANARLSAVDKPRDQISLQTTDAFNPTWTLGLGDTVAVDWSRLALDKDMRIKKLTYQWDTNGEVISMDLGERGRSVSRAMAGTNPGIRQEVEVNARHPQGATNIFQLNSYDNCDSNNPLIIPFYVSDEVLKVNKAQLNIFPKALRYYQNQSSDGGYDSYFREGDIGRDLGFAYIYSSPGLNGTDVNIGDPINVGGSLFFHRYNMDFFINNANEDQWITGLKLKVKNSTTGYTWEGPQQDVYIRSSTLYNFKTAFVDIMDVPAFYDRTGNGCVFQPMLYFGECFGANHTYCFHMYEQWMTPHSHSVEFGVFEADTATNLTWTAYVAEHGGAWNKVWSGTSSQANIDFKNYLVSGAWNDIKVTVNSACRIEAQAYIQGWVQSYD